MAEGTRSKVGARKPKPPAGAPPPPPPPPAAAADFTEGGVAERTRSRTRKAKEPVASSKRRRELTPFEEKFGVHPEHPDTKQRLNPLGDVDPSSPATGAGTAAAHDEFAVLPSHVARAHASHDRILAEYMEFARRHGIVIPPSLRTAQSVKAHLNKVMKGKGRK